MKNPLTDRIVSSLRRMIARDHLEERAFDARLGVVTGGYYDIESIDAGSSIAEHGHDYHGTPIQVLRDLVARIPGDPAEMTFVDYGSGFGRTLFAAIEIGFADAIGIEFCEPFHQQAVRNLAACRLPVEAKARIHLQQIDARLFELPPVPCVLYLFNPFDEELVAAVLDRILASCAARPRALFIIYYNPWYRGVLDGSGSLEVIDEGDFTDRSMLRHYYPYVIYQVAAGQRPATIEAP